MPLGGRVGFAGAAVLDFASLAMPLGGRVGFAGVAVLDFTGPMATLKQPGLDEILAFCAEDPIERVFLEDVARRGYGRFTALDNGGRIEALCHVGSNVVPSGTGCGAFAEVAAAGRALMVIGAEGAVTDLWEAARSRLPRPREDRPGQPVYVLETPPESGETGLRQATDDDLELLVPACAAAHREEIGIDPLARDPESFRWRTRMQIEDGRSWIWADDGTILFKAEASAWTPSAVQLQQVWVDPAVRGQKYAQRGMRDLCRLLLERVPAVCLFVRAENAPAIRVYESIGMRRVGSYRSLIF
jgi:ribosomal protein S18 acetylase RimI-like enzyme